MSKPKRDWEVRADNTLIWARLSTAEQNKAIQKYRMKFTKEISKEIER